MFKMYGGTVHDLWLCAGVHQEAAGREWPRSTREGFAGCWSQYGYQRAVHRHINATTTIEGIAGVYDRR